MTLQTLKFITVIAEYKSFSQAAKSLYMSQSTLSAAVKDLENELGIQIFIRNNRGVELSVEGEDFLTYARDILDRSNLLALRYKDKQSQETYFSVSSQHLPYAVRAFQTLMNTWFPSSYDAAIHETSTSNVLYDVSTRKSELGILAISEEYYPLIERSLQTYHLQFYELARLKTYVFLRRQHPLASFQSLKTQDLAPYPLVTYDQKDSPGYYTEEVLLFTPFQKNIRVSDRASKMLLLRNSDAFSFGVDLPNFNKDVYFNRKDTELVAIPLEGPSSETITGYLRLMDSPASEISDHYLTILREEISKLQLPVNS